MISTQGPIPLPLTAEALVNPSRRHPRLWWSSPMPADGCSMVARMPRYAPAASGIRRAPRIPATGQNGSSRHMLAFFDSSSRRISEQSSGLLIRWFGTQIPQPTQRASDLNAPPAPPVRGRPWKRRRCPPTVLTVHTDRPNGTDARPLYVRGQRTTTCYSATR